MNLAVYMYKLSSDPSTAIETGQSITGLLLLAMPPIQIPGIFTSVYSGGLSLFMQLQFLVLTLHSSVLNIILTLAF